MNSFSIIIIIFLLWEIKFKFSIIVTITFKGFRIFMIIKLVKMVSSLLKSFLLGFGFCLGLDDEKVFHRGRSIAKSSYDGVGLNIKSDSPFSLLFPSLCLYS